jgi:hypothetical protein
MFSAGREKRAAPLVEVDHVVSDGNIFHLADQLRWETIPARMETLKRLLIKELSRSGATEDRLHMVERNLANGADVILRQVRLVAKLKNDGVDTGSAERTLRKFEMIQELFVNFRAAIYKAGRGGP